MSLNNLKVSLCQLNTWTTLAANFLTTQCYTKQISVRIPWPLEQQIQEVKPVCRIARLMNFFLMKNAMIDRNILTMHRLENQKITPPEALTPAKRVTLNLEQFAGTRHDIANPANGKLVITHCWVSRHERSTRQQQI